jgi:iron complex transport system substrate-binding protein
MGDMKIIKKSMLDNMEHNPAWHTLFAVQNKQLYFLPQKLFLLNPGIHYPEAVKNMAQIVYPEVFKGAE